MRSKINVKGVEHIACALVMLQYYVALDCFGTVDPELFRTRVVFRDGQALKRAMHNTLNTKHQLFAR